MNIELRWVERGGPSGKAPDGAVERVLQYRERIYGDFAPDGWRWSDWCDVPVEVE